MRSWGRTIARWVLGGVSVLILLIGLVAAFLAFPDPLFAHVERLEGFTVYADRPHPDGFTDVIDDVHARIAGMTHERPERRYRVYVCGNERLYALFASLTRKGSNTLGISLSVFGTIYVNERKVERLAGTNRLGIRHSAYEGRIDEVIAHEIAHFDMVRALGFSTAVRFPVWKGEGYAEYQANRAALQNDPSSGLRQRLDRYMDDRLWGGRRPYVRTLLEWQMMVQYLVEVEGLDLHDLAEERVTESAARSAMIEWWKASSVPG